MIVSVKVQLPNYLGSVAVSRKTFRELGDFRIIGMVIETEVPHHGHCDFCYHQQGGKIRDHLWNN